MEAEILIRPCLSLAALLSVAALAGCTGYSNAWYMSQADFTGPGITPSQVAGPWKTVSNNRFPGVPVTDTRLADAAGAHYHVDPALVLAVCKQESSFNPHAVSVDGAEGLMQLMPDTAARMGVIRPFDPRQAIWGGTRYLSLLLKRFHGRLRPTLAAYNQGAATVAAEGNHLPPTAIHYVDGVLAKYRALHASEGLHDAD